MKKKINFVLLLDSFLALVVVAAVIGAIIVTSGALSGCVTMERTPYTEATIKTPEGLNVTYESTKDQDVEFERGEDGKIRKVKIRSSASAVEAERHEARRAETELMKSIMDKVPAIPVPK